MKRQVSWFTMLFLVAAFLDGYDAVHEYPTDTHAAVVSGAWALFMALLAIIDAISEAGKIR